MRVRTEIDREAETVVYIQKPGHKRKKRLPARYSGYTAVN